MHDIEYIRQRLDYDPETGEDVDAVYERFGVSTRVRSVKR